MKKSDLKKIIREEIQKEIFGLFNKKTPPPPPPPSTPKKPTPPPLSSFELNGNPITIEGISATGKGYHVWKGNNPLGDLRQIASKAYENGFGETQDKIYYIAIVNPESSRYLRDHVDRPAYFTVSTPKGGATKGELKAIADRILKLNPDGKIKIW